MTDPTPPLEPGLPLEAFAERLVAMARELHPDVVVDFVDGDAMALSVAWPDGSSGKAHLDNVWRTYQLSAEDGWDGEAVSQFLSLFRQPAELEPTLDNVVALVRSVATFQHIRQPGEAATPKNTVVARPLVADLAVVIGIDLPNSVAYLMEHDLEKVGAPREEIFERALANVLRGLEVRRHGDGPFFMLTAGGNFEASLLLGTELWTQLAEDVEGELIASVPCRDLLYYSSTGTEGGEEALQEWTQRMFRKGDHNLSPVLLRFTGEGWVEHR